MGTDFALVNTEFEHRLAVLPLFNLANCEENLGRLSEARAHYREVLRQIGPKLVIPMHIFAQASLEKFLSRAGGFFAVHRETGPAVVLSRAGLPATPEILVLAGR